MGDSLITIHNTESVHWYDKGGNPRHDATLREARKEFLRPSVTSILSIKDKPALVNWKVAQMLSQALTMHREADESDDAFIERVKAADEVERSKAPDLGTEVHRAIADYIAHTSWVGPSEVDLGPVGRWIDAHVECTGEVENRFASPLGFGGCIDYVGRVDGEPAIIDWKTQGVKGKPAFYDEWCWQLAAYASAFDKMGCSAWSVIIDTKAPGCYAKKWEPRDVERGWRGFCGLFEAWKADRKYDPLDNPGSAG